MFILRINKMIGFLFLTLDMSNLLYLKTNIILLS